MRSTVPDVIDQLVAAMNDHDADEVAACMAEDYRSEAPVHPERSFVGRSRVRENWRVAFEGTPDLEAELTNTTVEDGGTVWAEWRLRGTQTDGSKLNVCGVAIWGVEAGLIQWGRIYLEPVQPGGHESWASFFETDETDAAR